MKKLNSVDYITPIGTYSIISFPRLIAFWITIMHITIGSALFDTLGFHIKEKNNFTLHNVQRIRQLNCLLSFSLIATCPIARQFHFLFHSLFSSLFSIHEVFNLGNINLYSKRELFVGGMNLQCTADIVSTFKDAL